MDTKNTLTFNRLMLGSVMLIPGLLKLFVMTPDKITVMLSGITIFSFAPAFFAWILIISEIGAGIAIFANWNTKYAYSIGIIILTIAGLTMHWGKWPQVLVHLALASNYLVWASKEYCRTCKH